MARAQSPLHAVSIRMPARLLGRNSQITALRPSYFAVSMASQLKGVLALGEGARRHFRFRICGRDLLRDMEATRPGLKTLRHRTDSMARVSVCTISAGLGRLVKSSVLEERRAGQACAHIIWTIASPRRQ
jgi:hypothetical protein